MHSTFCSPNHKEALFYANFELGEILLSGVSLADNSIEFFSPIKEMIANYLNIQDKPLRIHFALTHWNTVSHHDIYDIISELNSSENKESVRFFWHYNQYDNDALDYGEDFRNIAKFHFELVEHKNKDILKANRTEHSPLIYFDSTGDLIIQGNSTIDSPLDFYIKPLMWLNSHLYKTNLREVSIEIHLKSITDSNIPFIQALIQTADCLNKDGSIVKIQWSYSNPEVEMIGEKCLETISSHYFFKKVVSK